MSVGFAVSQRLSPPSPNPVDQLSGFEEFFKLRSKSESLLNVSFQVMRIDYTLLADEFTVESGTLAHDMSLRREVIWDKYGREMGVGDAVGKMEN